MILIFYLITKLTNRNLSIKMEHKKQLLKQSLKIQIILQIQIPMNIDKLQI